MFVQETLKKEAERLSKEAEEKAKKLADGRIAEETERLKKEAEKKIQERGRQIADEVIAAEKAKMD